MSAFPLLFIGCARFTSVGQATLKGVNSWHSHLASWNSYLDKHFGETKSCYIATNEWVGLKLEVIWRATEAQLGLAIKLVKDIALLYFSVKKELGFVKLLPLATQFEEIRRGGQEFRCLSGLHSRLHPGKEKLRSVRAHIPYQTQLVWYQPWGPCRAVQQSEGVGSSFGCLCCLLPILFWQRFFFSNDLT